MDLEFTQFEFHVEFFSIKQSTSAQGFFFFFLYETWVFKTRFIEQTRVSRTRVSKKWYIVTYFVNSAMLLVIFAKSGKWPIWPAFLSLHFLKFCVCAFFYLQQIEDERGQRPNNPTLMATRFLTMHFTTCLYGFCYSFHESRKFFTKIFYNCHFIRR